MTRVFYGCSSLVELPDISNWDISSLKYVCDMFVDCSSLSCIPNIAKWNNNNINIIGNNFKGCSSSITIPFNSNWNMQKEIKLKDLININYSSSSYLSLNLPENNESFLCDTENEDNIKEEEYKRLNSNTHVNQLEEFMQNFLSINKSEEKRED